MVVWMVREMVVGSLRGLLRWASEKNNALKTE
jgi:hypothetical protein